MKDTKTPDLFPVGDCDDHAVALFDRAIAHSVPQKAEAYLTGQQRANIENTARWEAGMDFRLEATNRNRYPHKGLAWNTYDEEFRALLEEREK